MDFFFLCESEAVFVLSWTLRGHAGLCVFAPVWMNVRACVHACVCAPGPYGKSAPAVVSESIDRRLCASHVKFMSCTAFTKEAWNGFWGKIMPEQWEDGAEDNEPNEKIEPRKKERRGKDTKEER